MEWDSGCINLGPKNVEFDIYFYGPPSSCGGTEVADNS